MEKQTKNNRTIERRGMLKYLGSMGLLAGLGGTSLFAANTRNDAIQPRSIKVLVDFADSDHREMVMKNAATFKGLNAELLMRSFHYIDHDKRIESTFSQVHNHDNRTEVLAASHVVVTPCLVTAMEVKNSGSQVVYLVDEQTAKADKQKAESSKLLMADITQKSQVSKHIKILLKV